MDRFNVRQALFISKQDKWIEKKEIDLKKYEAEKAGYRNSLVSMKHRSVYRDWLANLEAQADIDRTPFENIN